jgi:hypothetical protein
MPEYSLRCEDCDQPWSELWSFNDYEKKLNDAECPECSSSKVYRDYSSDTMVTNYIKGLHECATLGEYADKQTKKYGKDKCEEMSQDFNKFDKRENRSGGMEELPTGMTRMTEDGSMPSPITKKQAIKKRKKKK